MRHHFFQDVGRQKVVSEYEIDEPISPGVLKTQIEGMGQAPVWAGVPVGQMRLIFLDDIHRAVRGTPVDDNIFFMRICLRNDALDRLLNLLGTVGADGNDGNQRLWRSHAVRLRCKNDQFLA